MRDDADAEANTVAIIGGGQAGAEVSTLLRQNRHPGRIILFGDENVLPYMRPPLSKAYLAGEIGADGLIYKAAAAYEKAGVELHLDQRVAAIDRRRKRLRLETGEEVAYGRLVIATGGEARRLAVPGAGLRDIFYLRTIADVEALRPRLEEGRRLAIVGGGYIGLEFAAVAVKRGLKVTVIEAAPRVLARVTAPEVSAFYEKYHRAAGAEIRVGAVVGGFADRGDGGVGAVLCGEALAVEADFVLVGVGLAPNTQLAEEAGLPVDDGILVDAASRTADPDIFAIGDCAMHIEHGFLKHRIRLESVPNALEQARAAAAALTGRPIPAATAPWFWSDQYDLKLQTAGIPEGYDELAIRGAPDAAAFVAFYLKDGVVIAADAINRPGDFMAARRLIGDRTKTSAASLADQSISLKTLLAAPAA